MLRFDAQALLLRLCALVPPPRIHLVRYAGIFAPNARGRAAMTGRKKRDTHRPQPAPCEPSRADLPALEAPCNVPPPNDPTRVRRLSWATLLRRTFALDVLRCPRCTGPMRLVGVCEDPAVIRAILTHLGLRHPPARAGPRATVALHRIDAVFRQSFDDLDGIDAPHPVDLA